MLCFATVAICMLLACFVNAAEMFKGDAERQQIKFSWKGTLISSDSVRERWLPLGHCRKALRFGVSASVNDD